MLDRKGIVLFTLITFVVTFAVEAVSLAIPSLARLAYLIILVPAAAAFITARLTDEDPLLDMEVLDVPRFAALRIAVLIPLIFAVSHVVTTVLGATRPDWRISETIAMLPTLQKLELPSSFAPLFPPIFLAMAFGISFVIGPTLYALILLGNEYGWRGFLLPRLMPLGKWPACLISGFLWWLTFGPYLTLQWEPASRMMFGVLSLVLTLILGILLGRVADQSRHVGLAAILVGVFVCQATVWPLLFPREYFALPLAGVFGIASLVIWGGVAAFPEFFFGKLRR